MILTWISLWSIWPMTAVSSSILHKHSYIIAMNAYNTGSLTTTLISQINTLIQQLGTDNVFISIAENGSDDGTDTALHTAAEQWAAAGVRSAVHTARLSAAELLPLVCARAGSSCKPGKSVRQQPSPVRIALMGMLRNAALEPLWSAESLLARHANGSLHTVVNPVASALYQPAALPESAATGVVWLLQQLGIAPTQATARLTAFPKDMRSAWLAWRSQQQAAGGSAWRLGSALEQRWAPRPHNLGLPRPIKVLFLNDVLFSPSDITQLLATRGGEYDAACAMDFELLKLYDTWVVRDITGRSLSPWYPYFRHGPSQAAARAGQPVPVYACWNGAVAFDGPALAARGTVFRAWGEHELRVPTTQAAAATAVQHWEHAAGYAPAQDLVVSSAPALAAAEAAVANGEFATYVCPASECQLIFKDMWALGAPRVYLHTGVHVYYNWLTWAMQHWLMPPVNTLFMSWANRIGLHQNAALRGGSASAPDMSGINSPVQRDANAVGAVALRDHEAACAGSGSQASCTDAPPVLSYTVPFQGGTPVRWYPAPGWVACGLADGPEFAMFSA